jgi:hypothetical protein
MSRVTRATVVVFTTTTTQHDEGVTEAEFTMKTSEHTMAPTLSDEVLRALHSVSGKRAEAASAMPKQLEQPSTDTVDSIHRLMIQPQGVRSIAPAPSARLVSKQHLEDKDRVKIDAIFACLAICADEERRAIAFGSRDAVAVTQRCIYSIKKKFGIS